MTHADDKRQAEVEKSEHKRYAIPVAVRCTLYKEDIKGKNSFQGFIRDISLGGVSLEIRDDTLVINDAFLQYVNIEMAFEITLPDVTHTVNISGVIRWYKKVKRKEVNLLYLGVQFLDLGKNDETVLNKYLALGAGDKSLIWNLWDSLSTQPSLE